MTRNDERWSTLRRLVTHRGTAAPSESRVSCGRLVACAAVAAALSGVLIVTSLIIAPSLSSPSPPPFASSPVLSAPLPSLPPIVPSAPLPLSAPSAPLSSLPPPAPSAPPPATPPLLPRSPHGSSCSTLGYTPECDVVLSVLDADGSPRDDAPTQGFCGQVGYNAKQQCCFKMRLYSSGNPDSSCWGQPEEHTCSDDQYCESRTCLHGSPTLGAGASTSDYLRCYASGTLCVSVDCPGADQCCYGGRVCDDGQCVDSPSPPSSYSYS
jgi:hypothetical protein